MSTSATLAAEDKPATKPAPVIELGAPFADNAILQRERPVPVWGWSKPGATITVEFAGQKETVKVGEDGKWLLKLKPLKANAEPADMLISDGEGNRLSSKTCSSAKCGMPPASPTWNGSLPSRSAQV